MSAHVPWQQLIADEVATGGVVIVRELVTRRLRREPTRSELTAARRAANRYAAAGHAEIARVPSRTGGHGNRLLLGLTPVETRIARPAPTARRGHPRSDLTIARGLVRTLYGAGSAARLLDADRIPPAAAATLATDLDDPIRDLTRLRLALLRRATADR